MRTTLISLILALMAVSGFCQRPDVLAAFKKYKIDPVTIDSLTAHNELRLSFDLVTTIVTESNEKVYKANHVAGNASDSGWHLQTVNNGTPSALDRNTFQKQHNGNIPALMPDTSTYKIVKDDGKELVISFQYDPASMVADNKFMKNAVVKLFFDAPQGRLLRSEGGIDKAFKIKMFKANYMTSTVSYQYQPTIGRYLPQKEEVSVNLSLLGQAVDMITTNAYSNYKEQ